MRVSGKCFIGNDKREEQQRIRTNNTIYNIHYFIVLLKLENVSLLSYYLPPSNFQAAKEQTLYVNHIVGIGT